MLRWSIPAPSEAGRRNYAEKLVEEEKVNQGSKVEALRIRYRTILLVTQVIDNRKKRSDWIEQRR